MRASLARTLLLLGSLALSSVGCPSVNLDPTNTTGTSSAAGVTTSSGAGTPTATSATGSSTGTSGSLGTVGATGVGTTASSRPSTATGSGTGTTGGGAATGSTTGNLAADGGCGDDGLGNCALSTACTGCGTAYGLTCELNRCEMGQCGTDGAGGCTSDADCRDSTCASAVCSTGQCSGLGVTGATTNGGATTAAGGTTGGKGTTSGEGTTGGATASAVGVTTNGGGRNGAGTTSSGGTTGGGGTTSGSVSCESRYTAEVLADSPLAYFHFDEAPGASLAIDAVSGGLDAGYFGSVGLGYPGKLGAAMGTFDGGYATYFPQGPLQGSFTVEVWVNPFDCSEGPIVSSRTGGPLNTWFGFEIQTNPGGRCDTGLHADIGSGENGQWLSLGADTPTPLVGEDWNYLAYVIDPPGFTIYQNGMAVAGALDAGFGDLIPVLWDPEHPLEIGATPIGSPGLNGAIDELAIYPTALGPGRIAAHYAASLCAVGDGG